MNQIFKNHSALQSELFSHLCELTYRTGSWNNLFQYLLLNMSWPGSIKAFRSLSCNEITEQRGKKSVLFLVTTRSCSTLLFSLGMLQAWAPQPGFVLGLFEGAEGRQLPRHSWNVVLGGPWVLDPPWWHSVIPCVLWQGSKVVQGNCHRMCVWDNTRQNYPSIKYTCLLWEGTGTELYSFFTILIGF